ncbi:MAG TPA: AAA family ATPase [Candidatus Limnocylindria bacterium]|jgi:RecA-family ATPase|nr:AAA family ATPase [Candidatus Limnocylindria bacterium]
MPSRPYLNGAIPIADEWAKLVRRRPRTPHLIQDIQPDAPGEFTIIGGRTGVGKTNLQMQMGLSMATGTPFLGKRCEPVEVAMLAWEGPEENVMERYMKAREQFPSELRSNFHLQFLPQESRGAMLETVLEKLKKTPGCKVAILDSVKYIVEGDYLKSRDVVEFFETLKPTLRKFGMSANIALPIKKPMNQGWLIDVEDVYEVKGCTEWVDTATTVMLMEKRPRKHQEHVEIGIPKHRIAVNATQKMKLFFDKKRCMFVPEVGQCTQCGGSTDDDRDVVVEAAGKGVQIRTVV